MLKVRIRSKALKGQGKTGTILYKEAIVAHFVKWNARS
jgi:hypothetical protein